MYGTARTLVDVIVPNFTRSSGVEVTHLLLAWSVPGGEVARDIWVIQLTPLSDRLGTVQLLLLAL